MSSARQLSCVIIDKLPFASPGDPITAARIEAIKADGGDAFQRLPGAAGDPRAAAGPRPADPAPEPTAACWRCSTRGCARWATAAGSWTRSRRRRSTHDLGGGRAIFLASNLTLQFLRATSAVCPVTSDRHRFSLRTGGVNYGATADCSRGWLAVAARCAGLHRRRSRHDDVKGKVVDTRASRSPAPSIVIESKGGVNRKLPTKTDKSGEFIQLLTESGEYQVTASAARSASQPAPRPRSGSASRRRDDHRPGAAAAGADDGRRPPRLKKAFEEGVTASRAGNHDAPSRSSTRLRAGVPNCFDCQFNIGVAYMAKKDEKQAEEAWKKALEMKPDYAEALNALATLYNNQKRFDEAAAMSAKAASGGGGRRRQRRRRSSTRASSSGTRARSPRPR